MSIEQPLQSGSRMTIEELRRVHQVRPFEPFRIHMADGRSVDVDHPEYMSFSRRGRVAYVSTPGEGLESIDLLLIASLEKITRRSHRRRNGRN
jgi:hypothetical protein